MKLDRDIVREFALQGCREANPAEPCDEPCDGCWKDAEALLREHFLEPEDADQP